MIRVVGFACALATTLTLAHVLTNAAEQSAAGPSAGSGPSRAQSRDGNRQPATGNSQSQPLRAAAPGRADGQAVKRAAGAKPPQRAAEPAPERFGIGRAATADEIQAIDIDVMPDGRGLPPGKGTAAEGKVVYEAKCRVCHGADGQGGPNDRLVGRDSGPNWNFATDPKLVKTVGNYWPYATTLFDYTRRAMPFMTPGTLTADETYGLVAYILALNKIVPEDMVMDQTSLPKVVMPARDRFVKDDRKGGPTVK